MADQLARGEEFEKKAEKKLSGWGLFGSKYEDAADLFDKAANSFKLAKSCIFLFLSHTSIIFFLYSIPFRESTKFQLTEIIIFILIIIVECQF